MAFDRFFKIAILVLVALAILAFYDSVNLNTRYTYTGRGVFDTHTGELYELTQGRDNRNTWTRIAPPVH